MYRKLIVERLGDPAGELVKSETIGGKLRDEDTLVIKT